MLEVVERQNAVLMSEEIDLPFRYPHIEPPSGHIVERPLAYASDIEVVACRKKRIVVIIRYPVAFRSHFFRIQKSEVHGLGLHAGMEEGSPVMAERQSVMITGLVLVSHQLQKFIFGKGCEHFIKSAVRGRIHAVGDLVRKILHIAAEIVSAPPGLPHLHHRKPPVKPPDRICLPVRTVLSRNYQNPFLHSPVCLRVIWLPSSEEPV